jgi:integrase/recombinase XerD
MSEQKILLKKYLAWMETMNYSGETIHARRKMIGYFIAWAEERTLTEAREITEAILERYRVSLAHHGQGEGRIKAGTQRTRLAAVREFFKWLTRERFILNNPAVNLSMPRMGSPLPSAVMSVKEVETLLSSVTLDRLTGIRDRAMFEVFYSTGIRRKELCQLKVNDIDLDRGLLMVRHGKGDKDRLIPIGERALLWVEKYLRECRDRFLKSASEDALFLTLRGPMKPGYMTGIGHRYLKASGLEKKGACHIYRHTMATLMLEGGAGIRHVQEMLGHASLESTQIYTRVAVQHLKDVHSSTHPGARLKRA